MEKLTHKSDEQRQAFCRSRGIDPAQHCCLDMAWFIAEPVEDERQGPNPVILWVRFWNEYRIDISHRGRRSTPIRFCPWCGSRLPKSRVDEWYKSLKALGYRDPAHQKLPVEFTTDQWWRHTST